MRKTVAAIVVLNALALASASAEERDQRVESKGPGKVCAAGPAWLKAVKGAVLVSRGGSFTQASEGMRLAAGDHVIARDGFANVVMGGAIVARVSDGVMITIGEKDGAVCIARVSASPSAVGQAEQGGGLDAQGLLLAGGALGALGVGLGVGISSVNSSNNNPNDNLPLTLSP
ncbi:hypothetical protein [Methylosinus sp. Sm6]|uniref:hypothetical protein n=1 Tax=Methylosinus sp. Sm6 TaxID=2866948 RepID=UPI001C99F97A|nr:hypothetical protein [Methylosinus sp. Sm6]MBY6243398.1 hypothetical protein [Methylosinus sp. Sm6]